MTSARTSPRPFCAILTALFCVLHTWLIFQAMGGWSGLNDGWPLWRDDHPLYYHSALVTRHFLAQSWTTAGYDPSFMAGYAKSVVFPASSTLPELVVATFGGRSPERAYKGYVFVSAALIPWLVAGAGTLWRSKPGATLASVGFFLVYVWTDFPINYAAFGMLPYLLAVPLGLAAAGAFCRYCERSKFGWWLVSAGLMTLVVLVHFTSVMVVAPAAAVGALSRIRSAGTGRRWVAGVLTIPLVVLSVNAFWWGPGLWLAGTKGPSDFAFAHPEGVLARLRQIVTVEPLAERVLWAFGLPGLWLVWRKDRVFGAALGAFTASGFFWGYLAGGFRSLDFLQPGRHTYACYTGLALASGSAVVETLGGASRLSRFRLDVPLLAVGLALGALVFGPAAGRSVRSRVTGPYPFLSSKPSPKLLWVMNRLKRVVKPGGRLLYEEGGFGLPGVPDPFRGGRFSGLIPERLGVELIGGPYLHAALTTNFTQFGEGRLFERADWGRDRFVRYARLYRPSAVLCWSPRARAFCRANPDLIRVTDDDGLVLIGRVTGFEGAAIVGKAEVEATPGRLKVTRAEAGVDGFVILRYHSVPCLRADPPVPWEPVHLEDDPVPFIKFRPTSDVTFSLRIPPGSRGAPGP